MKPCVAEQPRQTAHCRAQSILLRHSDMQRCSQNVLARESLRLLLGGVAAGKCNWDSKSLSCTANVLTRWLATTSHGAADPFGVIPVRCH